METHDIDKLRARIGDRLVIASVSGGKDSTAMCLYLRELGIPYRAINIDTGWEHADTDHYVREVLPAFIGPIETIAADVKVRPSAAADVERIEKALGRPSQMVRLILNKGTFPGRERRFCTEQLKIFPIRDYIAALGEDVINCTGIRADESAARALMPEWEEWPAGDCEQWRPLIDWSGQDVVDIHKRHGVPPNPLYLRGAHRVGCWPCIYARKSEIRNMSETDPARVDLLELLEDTLTGIVQEKQIQRGVPLSRRGWFRNPTPIRDPETGKRKGDPWPIRRVVEWAKTKRGGKQYELFAPPAREWGCMRWGVCDTGASGGEE